jgi:hypothetical protein
MHTDSLNYKNIILKMITRAFYENQAVFTSIKSLHYSTEHIKFLSAVDHIENKRNLYEIFSSIPTYKYANTLYLSDLNLRTDLTSYVVKLNIKLANQKRQEEIFNWLSTLSDLEELDIDIWYSGHDVTNIDFTKLPKNLGKLTIAICGKFTMNLEHPNIEEFYAFGASAIVSDINFDKCPKLVIFGCDTMTGKIICSQERFFKKFGIRDKTPQDDDWKNITVFLEDYVSAFITPKKTYPIFDSAACASYVVNMTPERHDKFITLFNCRHHPENFLVRFNNLEKINICDDGNCSPFIGNIMISNICKYMEENKKVKLSYTNKIFCSKIKDLPYDRTTIENREFSVGKGLIDDFMEFIDSWPSISFFKVITDEKFPEEWLRKFNSILINKNDLFCTKKPHPGCFIFELFKGEKIEEDMDHLEIYRGRDIQITGKIKNLFLDRVYFRETLYVINLTFNLEGTYYNQQPMTIKLDSGSKKLSINAPRSEFIIDCDEDVLLDYFYIKCLKVTYSGKKPSFKNV